MANIILHKDGGEKLGSPCQTIELESWGDLIAFVTDDKLRTYQGSGGTSGQGASQRERDASWAGTFTWSEAESLMRNGWPDGEERVHALARRIEVKLVSRIVREDVNYDVEGMSFDVARYLDGEPEHWTRLEESTMQADAHRHVKVVLNVAVSAGIDKETIEARGAAVAALVELLEYAGHRVELWVISAWSATYGGGGTHPPNLVHLVRVKPYDQPLDMGRVVFATTHVAMSRRVLMGACHERADASILCLVGPDQACGYPTDYTPDDTSIYIGKAGTWEAQWTDPASAETWVLAKLAEQGVVIRDET